MREVRISYSEAERRIVEFVRECDADTLAAVFQDCFGGRYHDVFPDEETEELVYREEVNEEVKGFDADVEAWK